MVRRQNFADAVRHFERSFEFFEIRPWLDNYRAFLLLSPSSISYREMALANAGFCYSQIGDGVNARKYYERCLEMFPDSMLASTALQMLNAGGNSGVVQKSRV
jgi:tetratricopeptide (TPR) repeat protein